MPERFDIYLTLFQTELLPKFAPAVRSIYDNRAVFRNLLCTDFVVAHLSGLLLAAAENNQRFRTLDWIAIS